MEVSDKLDLFLLPLAGPPRAVKRRHDHGRRGRHQATPFRQPDLACSGTSIALLLPSLGVDCVDHHLLLDME